MPVAFPSTPISSRSSTPTSRVRPDRPDGRLFVGAHAGPVTDRTYLRVFHRARTAAFTAAEAASP